MPSMAATASELVTRYSKLVEVDVEADAEPLIAPYRAELSGTPNLLCVPHQQCLIYSIQCPDERPSRAIKERSSLS